MSLLEWSLAKIHLDNKIEFILNTYLNDCIDDINAEIGYDTDNKIQYPRYKAVGINAIGLQANSNPVDQFPAVTVYEVSSTNTVNDIVDSQDDLVTYSIIAADVADAGSIQFSARRAKYLANAVLEVLEKYLPESPGDAGNCVTYRVDPINTAQNNIVPIKQNHLYMAAYEVRLNVYTRTLINYQPTRLPANKQEAYVPSNFDAPPIPFGTDFGLALGTTVPSNFVTGSLSLFNFNLTSFIDFDVSGLNIPDGSSWYCTNQNLLGTLTGSISSSLARVNVVAGPPTLPAPALFLQSGHTWTLQINHETFKTPMNYGIRWTIT
jgi:hypothetical protein